MLFSNSCAPSDIWVGIIATVVGVLIGATYTRWRVLAMLNDEKRQFQPPTEKLAAIL